MGMRPERVREIQHGCERLGMTAETFEALLGHRMSQVEGSPSPEDYITAAEGVLKEARRIAGRDTPMGLCQQRKAARYHYRNTKRVREAVDGLVEQSLKGLLPSNEESRGHRKIVEYRRKVCLQYWLAGEVFVTQKEDGSWAILEPSRVVVEAHPDGDMKFLFMGEDAEFMLDPRRTRFLRRMVSPQNIRGIPLVGPSGELGDARIDEFHEQVREMLGW